MSEHHWHVKEVLKCLCKAGFYAKAEKCEFHSELVEYLGYILSPSGLTVIIRECGQTSGRVRVRTEIGQ